MTVYRVRYGFTVWVAEQHEAHPDRAHRSAIVQASSTREAADRVRAHHRAGELRDMEVLSVDPLAAGDVVEFPDEPERPPRSIG